MQTFQAILESRLQAAVGESAGVPVTVQMSADSRFGDYQSNVAMQLAKARKANPRTLAQEIISRLEVADIAETPEIAGAGFINFRIKRDAWVAQFAKLATDARLGVPEMPARRMVIDFSSP